MYKAGHEYLLAFKLTIPIYDYTVEFCNRWVGKYSRLKEQMEQAARSGSQNIAEGYKQQSLKDYIKLVGVARGSLEELLKDYQAFARQNKIEIWDMERAKREIGEIRKIWEIMRDTPVLPDNPNFPNLPSESVKAVNLLIVLISQANYLLDRLVASLKEKHRKEGGFTEKLYRARREYKNRGNWGR